MSYTDHTLSLLSVYTLQLSSYTKPLTPKVQSVWHRIYIRKFKGIKIVKLKRGVRPPPP